MRKYGILIFSVLVIVFSAVIDKWNQDILGKDSQEKLKILANKYQMHIQDKLEHKLETLKAVQALYSINRSISQKKFNTFVSKLFNPSHPIRALQFADSNTVVKNIYPIKGNEITINKPMTLINDKNRYPFIQKAIVHKITTFQGPINLRRGDNCLVLRAPIFYNDNFSGLVILVFDMRDLLHEFLEVFNTNEVCFSILDNKSNTIFCSLDKKDYSVSKKIEIADTHWTLIMGWKPEHEIFPLIPRLALWLGGLSILISGYYIFYSAYKSSINLEKMVNIKTQDIKKANLNLINEIEERKHVENKLIESRDILKNTFNSFQDLIIIVDDSFRIIYSNWRGFEHLDKKLKTSKPFCYKILVNRDRPCSFCPVKKTFTSGDISHVENSEISNDKIFEIHAFPIKSMDGKDDNVISIYRDITNIKNMRKEKILLDAHFRQNQKLEAIGALAGGIAHDFNNILTPLMGYSELLIRNTPHGSNQYLYIQEIITASKRAKDLVRQILAFSRKSDRNLHSIKIQNIIFEVLKLTRASLPSTIRVVHNIDKNCSEILGDSTEIHQIAMNLITNAFHAMEDYGGTLSITLSRAIINPNDSLISLLKPGEYTLLEISDTGIGMSKSTMENIFDPYFTTKPMDKGTGLGLSVLHGIVNKYGGRVDVKSELGVGSTFKVYFPSIKSDTIDNRTTLDNEIFRGTENIMIVDDETSVLNIETNLLESLGYKTFAFSSSEHALKVFKSNPYKFDLVLSDVTMPTMRGDQLAKELINIRNNIPIILCTGCINNTICEEAIQSGVKCLLTKPISLNELSNAIRKALN